MTLRLRLIILTDRLLAVLVASLLVGTTLAFGGAVWWARPAIAALTFLFVLAWLGRTLLEGTWRVIKSPLTLLGLLGLLLAFAQLVPLPDRLAGLISPRSRAIHALGVFPDRLGDPSIELPEPEAASTPVTVDRPSTLRWLAGATACLALFWGVGQYADRLGHLYVVWGSVVVAFFLNTTIGVVQLLAQSGGVYGAVEPGKGGPNTPSLDALLTAPNATVLRLASVSGEAGAESGWAVARPGRPFQIGTMLGGPGAYLALGALALPLALSLALQLLAPRGSREPAWVRLRLSGQVGLLALLCGLIALGAGTIGLMAGPVLGLPFAIGLLLAGLPCARSSGLRRTAVALTFAALVALALGMLLGECWPGEPGTGGPLATRRAWESGGRVWADAARILGDFPVLGSGLGSFAAIYPFYKSQDQAQTTALSSLIQWSVEAGATGIGLLVLGGLWCAWRVPAALRAVGTADRALAFGLLGAVACFGLFSAMHWTVEMAAVAVAASAVGGTCDRWLAGGTDLFVERL